MSQLGRIKQVDLRKAWNHEAHHFTQWLADQENVALLSDEIGIDIHVLETEASVGKFNVDILAEEENTGRKIIIENQLEQTNHDHLGKVITYASGYDAEIIVWIVKDVRDEHKQAVDWLNEHTDENINFFAIKMELWQIGDSPLAPKFQVISKPNDWAKAIKKSSYGKMTETKVTQLEFWNQFKDYAQENGTNLKLRKALPQHWYNISLGNSMSHIGLTINSQDGLMACELYIPNNQELFEHLFSLKPEIEKEINKKISWMPLDGKKASKIRIETEFSMEDDWVKAFAWLREHAEIIARVFPKYIKKYKSNA